MKQSAAKIIRIFLGMPYIYLLIYLLFEKGKPFPLEYQAALVDHLSNKIKLNIMPYDAEKSII